MSFIKLDCPYCDIKGVSFQSVAEHVHVASDTRFTVFFHCNHCDGGISALVKQFRNVTPHNYNSDINNDSRKFFVSNTYPKFEEKMAPEHLPENIKKFFLEGVDNFTQGKWDSAGTMFRKVLDVSTRKLCTNAKARSMTLEDRIDDMADKNLITPSMQEWAHEIRLIGNDCAHDDEPIGEKDATDIYKFTELFLMYSYTLPGMLEARKLKDEKE